MGERERWPHIDASTMEPLGKRIGWEEEEETCEWIGRRCHMMSGTGIDNPRTRINKWRASSNTGEVGYRGV